MRITPTTRRDLVLTYAVILVAAWTLAYGFAGVSRSIQHAWLPEPYLLLPINLISFHLLPLSAVGIVAVAVRVSGWRANAIVAAVLVAAFTAARLFYWWNVASQIGTHSAAIDYAEWTSARPPTFWITGLVGMSAYVALVAAIVRTFAALAPAARPDTPPQPASGG